MKKQQGLFEDNPKAKEEFYNFKNDLWDIKKMAPKSKRFKTEKAEKNYNEQRKNIILKLENLSLWTLNIYYECIVELITKKECGKV